MVKGKPLLRWAGIMLVCASLTLPGIAAQGATEPVKAPESGRPDLIKIDTLASYGKLELPPVTFFHDKHTDALLKEKKNCETCHLVENGKLSLTFKRKKGTNPAEIKDIYHANCVGCHEDTAAAGKKAGPLDGFCRDCHNAKPQYAAARVDAGLNNILHYRHLESKAIPAPAGDKDNCASCHHDYDKKDKKIFYAKGKETTCRYCHLDKPKDNVKSMEQASHLQCVLCHLDLANKGWKETGPYLCAGCHSAGAQALVAKTNRELVAKLKDKEVPRLKRGQPDAALITYDPKAEEEVKPVKPLTMNPVPFDHKAHEKYNDTCRVCHHAAMDACQKCHTLAGSKEGEFVNLEKAMHLKSSDKSCSGCHTAKQAAPDCAGCHHRLVETARPDEATCRQCHMDLPRGASPETLAKLTPPQKAGLAGSLLKGRTKTPGTYPLDDIPDKVEIKDLVDRYKASELTHRQHVLTLMKGMQDNPLAAYFHRDPGTICQGCHHNSPPSKTPPRCGNCHAGPHGKTAFDPKETSRPTLKAALHMQCMGCHKDMDLAKPAATACTECHEERKK